VGAATLVGAFVSFLRSDTPGDKAVIVAIVALLSVALWRVDRLRSRGQLDLLLLTVGCGMVAILVAVNVILSQRVDSATSARDALEAKNEQLQGQLDDVGDQSVASTGRQSHDSVTTSTSRPATTSSATTPPPTGHDAGPGIYSNGNVELSTNDLPSFDLDLFESYFDVYVDVDLNLLEQVLSGHNGAELAFTESTTFAACSADLSWVSYVPVDRSLVGQDLCVRTDQGRLGVLTITGVSSDGDDVTFVATIWNTP
jgi:hypothetical protein